MDSAAETPLAVLADPTRTRIVQLLRDAEDGRAMVSRLAEQLGLRQPTVSHHMAMLHAEGLVVRQPEGRRVWYSIAPDEQGRIAALLGTPAPATDEPDWDLITDDLTARFRGVFGRATVARLLTESRDLLLARGEVPLLGSRATAFAASRLDALHRSRLDSPRKPSVLFVCVQNAGRSQLAAGILRHLAGDGVEVHTAGSAPASDVRAAIVSALDEIGVSIGGEFPKPLTDEAVKAADVVVTMGCGDACPVYPGRRYLDWQIDDPVDQPFPRVREIRDDIERRVRALLGELPVRSSD